MLDKEQKAIIKAYGLFCGIITAIYLGTVFIMNNYNEILNVVRGIVDWVKKVAKPKSKYNATRTVDLDDFDV